MGIAKLNIEQQFAKISVDIQPARITVDRPEKSMHIHQEAPEMTVHWESPSFQLDFEEQRAELSQLTDPPIQTTSNQMTIFSPMPIQDIAVTHEDDEKLRVMGTTPAAGVLQTLRTRQTAPLIPQFEKAGSPSVKWVRGDMSIEWSDHEFSIEWEGESLPQITVEPCSVDIYIEQKPYIRIYLDEENLPKAVGKEVDAEL